MGKTILVIVGICLFLGSAAEACTIFCFTHNGKTYFCNNEDWKDPITDIYFHPAEGGSYGWVGFGFANNWAQGGVNDQGLCFDWVAGGGPFGWKPDPSREDYRGNISEEMLRSCKDVDEAIELFKRFNVSHLDYSVSLIADKAGNSVLVRWRDGKLELQKRSDRFHSCGSGKDAVDRRLEGFQGVPSIEHFANALRAGGSVGRGGTKYSSVASLSDGKIFLFQNRNYDEHVEIDYLAKLKGPSARLRISSLFLSADPEPHVSRGSIKRTDDYLAVKALLEGSLEGKATGDIEDFRRSFHDGATIMETKEASQASVSMTQCFQEFAKAAAGQSRTTRIVSLDVTQTEAVARLEVDYLTYSLVDDSKLRKVDGRWGIVEKVYRRQEQDNRTSLALALVESAQEAGYPAALKTLREFSPSDRYYSDEGELNQIGYDLLWAGKVSDAILIFEATVEAFPDSANAYDSLGEAYAKDGNKELAIVNYTKAIELNPMNSAAIEILSDLKGK